MKTVLTLTAVFFFGIAAMAQNTNEVKVDTTIKTVKLNIELTEKQESQNDMARLYRFKNSRIKKALAFRTKLNRAKLA